MRLGISNPNFLWWNRDRIFDFELGTRRLEAPKQISDCLVRHLGCFRNLEFFGNPKFDFIRFDLDIVIFRLRSNTLQKTGPRKSKRKTGKSYYCVNIYFRHPVDFHRYPFQQSPALERKLGHWPIAGS